MMEYILFFLAGLGSCFGVCGLTCSPVVMPYLVLTSKNSNERIKGFLKFITSKLLVSSLLCLLIIFFGHSLIKIFETFRSQIYILIGFIIIALGSIFIFTRNKILCFFLPKDFLIKRQYELFLLGGIVALFPCLPRLGIFSIITFCSKNIFQGMGYFYIYFLGEMISLFLLLNVFHLAITRFLSSKLREIFFIVLGVIIIFFGVNLVLKGLLKE